MFRPLSLYIGSRYTRARRRSHFVSFISFTSIAGLAIGVLVMIVVLSVMNGFDREMRERVLALVPQLIVEAPEPITHWRALSNQLMTNPQLQAVAPYTELKGMLASVGRAQKIFVQAIDPKQESRVSIIDDFFLPGKGSLASLKPGEFGLILGDTAAKRLAVSIGDKVTFIAPEVAITPAGMFPRMKRFTVVGLFHTGAGELDGYMALAHYSDAALLRHWQKGQVQGLRFKLKDLFQARTTAWEVYSQLPEDYAVGDWTGSHGNLYQAIHMEKAMISLLLALIVAVAAFNIVSTLVMVVNDKHGDIAILRTLGATPGSIMRIFIVQGAIIGLVGTLVGAVLGVLTALNVSSLVALLEKLLGHKFLNADIYFIDYLPSQVQLGDVVTICAAALALSFLATLYPAWRAARTRPAEVLRYE